jgi:SAM-dependent methyltransferase
MNTDRPPICDYEGSDYQQSFWEDSDRAYEDRVETVALLRLLPSRGDLLLEVGAGAGRNTPRYEGFDRIVLLDYSLTQLQQARARLGSSGRFIYVAADAYRLPFHPGLFDAATMIRTLHHMADPPRALRQVRAALQPSGVFILEYPNKRNIKAILRYVLGRQKWNPFKPEAIEFAELNFDFHPRSVRSWLAACGFRIERQLTVSHFRMSALKRFVPLRLLVGMDSLAQLTGDLWQYSPSVFVRAIADDNGETATQGVFFRCPTCEHDLFEGNADELVCPNCARHWVIRDGIYDFRE